MKQMIKLSLQSNTGALYLNKAHIVAVRRAPDGAHVLTTRAEFAVCQAPEQIITLIEGKMAGDL
jgi:hypothetical protein